MTKIERETEDLLMQYAKASQHVKDATKERDRLKALVEALTVGQYGGWIKAYGESREILDQQGVRDLCAKHGLTVPLSATKPPLIVREVR